MSNNASNQVLIGKLLKVCISGNLDLRSLYLDGLVTSLDIFLNEKRTEKVDQVREAIAAYMDEMLRMRGKDDELRAQLNREFYERFVVNSDVWFSDAYSDDAILTSWIAQIGRAKKLMRKAHQANEDRLRNLEGGFSDTAKYYGQVLDMCQKCCEAYGLFEFSEDDRIADFIEDGV